MRNWLKTVLFISAFSPALLVLAGVRFYSIGEVDVLACQLAIVSVLGTVLPILIIIEVKRNSESIAFKAKKIESADYFLLVFIAGYLSPIAMKISEVNPVIMVVLLVVISAVAWVVSNIPSHPILYLFNYRFYKVESEDGMVYILITRRNIRSPRDVCLVKKINHGMLME